MKINTSHVTFTQFAFQIETNYSYFMKLPGAKADFISFVSQFFLQCVIAGRTNISYLFGSEGMLSLPVSRLN